IVEVERFERLRTDSLDVPRVKELVRRRAEQPSAICPDRGRGREDGAVAMLHPVAVGPRQIIGDEGVGTAVVGRKLAVHAALLSNDLLDVALKSIELRVCSFVIDADAERWLALS